MLNNLLLNRYLPQATKDLQRLGTHVWFLVGALLLLHLGCCITALVTIKKQKVYVINVSEAGVKNKPGPDPWHGAYYGDDRFARSSREAKHFVSWAGEAVDNLPRLSYCR